MNQNHAICKWFGSNRRNLQLFRNSLNWDMKYCIPILALLLLLCAPNLLISQSSEFAPAQVILDDSNVLYRPQSMVSGDIDNDGDPDIVVGSNGWDLTVSGYLYALYNDGSGNFGPLHSIDSSFAIFHQTVLADVNGDGENDLITLTTHELSWYPITAGVFGSRMVISTGDGGFDLAAVDIDSDGSVDVFSSWIDGNVVLLHRYSAGSWSEQVISTDDKPSAIEVIDWDGDGLQDLLYGSGDIDHSMYLISDVNDPSAPAVLFLETLATAFRDINTGDLDGDGDIDLGLIAGKDSIIIVENDGSTPVVFPVGASSTTSIELVDLDGDNLVDVLLNSALTSENFWLPGQGDFTFGPIRWLDKEGVNPRQLVAIDLDGDGDRDVLARFSSDFIGSYANLGGGLFDRFRSLTKATGLIYSIELADVESDGDLDVICINRSDASFSTLR